MPLHRHPGWPTRHGLRRSACVMFLLLTTACSLRPYVADEVDLTQAVQALETARFDPDGLGERVKNLDPAAVWPPAVWTPAQLGLVAAMRSPGVRQAEAARRAAQAARTLAMQRENPQFSLGLERHSLVDDNQSGRLGIGPSLSFTLPPRGRRALVAARAEVEVTRARLSVLAAAWAARDAAANAALQVLANRELAAGEAQASEARAETIAAARASVAAGIADPFEWQTLVLTANDARLARLARLLETTRAEAALAASLVLPVTELHELPLAQPTAVSVPTYETLQESMLKRDPAMLGALADFDAADRDLALAVHQQYPSLQLNPGYFFSQGDHVWSLLGGVVVPVFASHDAAIASAEAARAAAREQVLAVQARSISALREAYAHWQSSLEVRAEAEAIATDVSRHHAELAAKAEEGIVDRLTVRRAAQQVAEMGVQLMMTEHAVRAARHALESLARMPLDDTVFPRYLEQLQGADDAQPDS